MRRLLSLILVLAALAPAAVPAVATAQDNPFGPLPQTAPQATPVPTATPGADDATISRPFLLGIAAVVALVFLGIGFYITRDARRHLTDDDRRALERTREREAVSAEKMRTKTAKTKARSAGKRQRQARKAQRRR